MTPAARGGDPWTSWAAAESVRHLRTSQAEVLYILMRRGPLTHRDLVLEVVLRFAGRPHSDSGIRTRTAELVDMGLVRDSGQVATLESGRKAVLWEATPGREVASALAETPEVPTDGELAASTRPPESGLPADPYGVQLELVVEP